MTYFIYSYKPLICTILLVVKNDLLIEIFLLDLTHSYLLENSLDNISINIIFKKLLK